MYIFLHRKVEDLQFKLEEEEITLGDELQVFLVYGLIIGYFINILSFHASQIQIISEYMLSTQICHSRH